MDCSIIHATDSLIFFQMLTPEDFEVYSIPISDTYGYVLENPLEKQKEKLRAENFLVVKNGNTKYEFPEGKGIIYGLFSDSVYFPRRGKISDLVNDSIEIEQKFKRKIRRIAIPLNKFSFLGISTPMQDFISFVVFPFPKENVSSVHLFTEMSIKDGWTYQIESKFVNLPKKKKKRKQKFIRLPVSVKKVLPRKNK